MKKSGIKAFLSLFIVASLYQNCSKGGFQALDNGGNRSSLSENSQSEFKVICLNPLTQTTLDQGQSLYYWSSEFEKSQLDCENSKKISLCSEAKKNFDPPLPHKIFGSCKVESNYSNPTTTSTTTTTTTTTSSTSTTTTTTMIAATTTTSTSTTTTKTPTTQPPVVTTTSTTTTTKAPMPTSELTQITFLESTENIPNPERGFYDRIDLMSLTEDQVISLRDKGNSIYQYPIRLIYTQIDISNFRNSDFSSSFLQTLEAKFMILRKSSMKIIPRFVYDDSEKGLDATSAQIQRHLSQVGPILSKYQDVIADF